MAKVLGRDLKPGDVIDTWAGKKRITALELYDTAFSREIWPQGARIAAFDIGGGMTIVNDDLFEPTSFEPAA